MSSFPDIVCDPAILDGKPVIAGTRLSVELILEKMAAGRTLEELLVAHPNLSPEGVQAAIRLQDGIVDALVAYEHNSS